MTRTVIRLKASAETAHEDGCGEGFLFWSPSRERERERAVQWGVIFLKTAYLIPPVLFHVAAAVLSRTWSAQHLGHLRAHGETRDAARLKLGRACGRGPLKGNVVVEKTEPACLGAWHT